MTYEQRQAKGKVLCEKLASYVAVIAPKGIGRWDRCWEFVDAPSVEFMLSLSAWETSPSDEAALKVSNAYDGVMQAWREAAGEYTRRAKA